MNEIKTLSLADQVFEKLEDDIITGVYPRGEILTELRLVEQLGVSRTPIREALRRLQQEKLIADSGKGSVVLGITEEDLVDIMEIRQRLEGLAARCAAENLTQEGMDELQKISALQSFYFEKRDVDQLRRVDDSFHHTVYALSGRQILRDTLLIMHKKTLRYRRISMADPERMRHTVAEHHAVSEAICRRDPEAAEEAMLAHIINAKESMIERFRKHG